jgi:radical SAM superfamily enzyme YgiQ (UPF0313 family)
MLAKDYGARRFIISDEGFAMFPEKVKEFCRQTIAKGNRFTYFTATGLRLNRIDDEMCQLMKKARFETSFGVGIESAVPRVRQDLMNKQLTQEQLINGLKIFKRNGFRVVGNFILGYPGETKQEMIETVNWACKSKLLSGANLVPFLPVPGTPIINKLTEEGKFPKEWDFSKLNLSGVIYAPEGVSIDELDRIRKWAVWKYNFRPRMLIHYLRPQFLPRAIVTTMRLYLPNWLLPKNWKRL